MKKIYFFFLLVIILLIFFTTYILQDSQNKLTLKIKSSIPKDIRYFIKDTINLYLYNFDINFKFIKISQIKSDKKKKYFLKEFNNKFLDYQGPRSYLAYYNDKLFLVTGTGILAYGDIYNLSKNENFKLNNINSNIKEVVKYKDFFLNSNFGVKGILIDKKSIYLAISNEIRKDCYNISILKSDINLENLQFIYLFNPNECVEKNNSYGEFQPIQSGGVVEDFDENYFLLTTGEFRFRDHAQSNNSVFGKILLINKNNGDYKIISKGHRNAQGLFYDKENNVIVNTEHGPFGGDEVNINKNIFQINNFGWPISSYGEHYPKMASKDAYEKAPLYKSHSKYGFIEPIKYFVPSIGITQILKTEEGFQNSDNHNYFFASLGYADRVNALSIHQIVFDEDYQTILYEDKLRIGSRIRDILYLPKEKLIVGYLEKKGSLIILSQDDQ